MDQTEITIRLDCTDLPSHGAPESAQQPVSLGVQRGKTAEQLARADQPHVVFDLPFRLGRRADDGPNFQGPYAQGTPAARFVYLCWCEGDDPARMVGRAKVSLAHLTWQDIAAAGERDGVIEAQLRLSDAHGRPLCATVKDTHITWKC